MSTPSEPLAMRRRIISSVVVIAAAIVLAIFGFQRLKSLREESKRSDAGQLPPLVRAGRAERVDYTEILRGYGRAHPLRRATVVAEVAGVATDISKMLEPGTAIVPAMEKPTADEPEGAPPSLKLPVLVRLDDRDLADRAGRAGSDAAAAAAEIRRLASLKGSLRERLAAAGEELETAQRELDRIASLVPKTLSKSDLDAQQIQVTIRLRSKLLLESQSRENVEALQVAEAKHAALLRTEKMAKRELGRARVRAPFAGRIETRHVNVGERVRVGDPLFTIVDLSRVEVPVALPAGRYDDVHPGSRAVLRRPDETRPLWEGTVARIAPTINASERTFFAYLVVEGAATETPAPPGAHLIAEVSGRVHKGVIPVPRRAFLGERVFIATARGDGTEASVSERRPVVVRYLAGVALTKEGIETGELFLVTNLESVAEGSVVRLAPEVVSPSKSEDDAERPK